MGVAVAGNTVYVGAGAGGLVILDVTTPSTPSEQGRYQGSGVIAQNLAILGSLRGERRRSEGSRTQRLDPVVPAARGPRLP